MASSTKVTAVRETFRNATEGHLIGVDACTDLCSSDPGELFRLSQREYGRCVSKVYVDTEQGTKACGWVFEAIDHYEDTGEPYLREVWVELLAQPDTVVRTSHPFWLETA